MSVIREIDNLYMCVDCLMLHANGDTSGMSDDRAETIGADIEALWATDDELTFWNLVPACDGDCEGHFSWSSCDSCGSTLGGDRHLMVAFLMTMTAPTR